MATQPGDFTDAYFDDLEDLENRHPWPCAMRKLTLGLLSAYSPRMLLDAGCGTGGFLLEWSKQTPSARAVGVDFARAALTRARRRFDANWVQASAADLPFADRAFDAIHCADVLQHLSLAESERALDRFAALLKPGGVLALRVRATRLGGNSPDVDYSHAFTPHSLRTALTSRGFDVRLLTRVNAAGSLWAELAVTQGGVVGGIARHRAEGWRARALNALLSIERYWVRAGLPVPIGHTIIAVAVRR